MPDIILCSKHDKGRLISPYLSPLGYRMTEYTAFNTDELGTFSGEIERKLTPKEAALSKAQKACELTGVQFGLGSEGSFGGGPMPGLVNWNEEILCLFDSQTQRAVYAIASGPTKVNDLQVASPEQLQQELEHFPDQAWIWRAPEKLHKAMTARRLLDMAAQSLLPFPLALTPDLRAMYCPARQGMIQQAAQDLVRRIEANCPACQAFNFVVNNVQRGLPCGLCKLPTQQIRQSEKICECCGYQEVAETIEQPADPAHCPFCNP